MSQPSIHSSDDIPAAPEGWVGGELANTGGGIYARMWVHPECELRVGYSVTEPSMVGVERVRLEGEDERNPLVWVHDEDVEGIPCEGEEGCLETALEAMRDLDTGAA